MIPSLPGELAARSSRGERALITGCSSGIGQATARALDAAGLEVYASARDPVGLAALTEIDDNHKLQLDVTDNAAVERAVRVAEPLDVLINSAGYGLMGAVEEIEDDELRDQYEVNVFGAWRLCRAALAGMRARQQGTIINISSYGGQMPYPGIGAYRSSKFALEGMTATLHLEVARFGIRVIMIQPGLVATDFGTRSLKVARRVEPAYRTMKQAADAAYDRMSPPPGLSPDAVAAAIRTELSRKTGPLRVAVGDDAERNLAAARRDQSSFERYLEETLGLVWRSDD